MTQSQSNEAASAATQSNEAASAATQSNGGMECLSAMERLVIRKRREIPPKPSHPIREMMPTLLMAMALIASPPKAISNPIQVRLPSPTPPNRSRVPSPRTSPFSARPNRATQQDSLHSTAAAASTQNPTDPPEEVATPASQETNPSRVAVAKPPRATGSRGRGRPKTLTTCPPFRTSVVDASTPVESTSGTIVGGISYYIFLLLFIFNEIHLLSPHTGSILVATTAIEAVASPIDPVERIVHGFDLVTTPNEPDTEFANIIEAVREISLEAPPRTGKFVYNYWYLDSVLFLRCFTTLQMEISFRILQMVLSIIANDKPLWKICNNHKIGLKYPTGQRRIPLSSSTRMAAS